MFCSIPSKCKAVWLYMAAVKKMVVEQWNWSGLMVALKEHERRDCQPQFSDVHFFNFTNNQKSQQRKVCI